MNSKNQWHQYKFEVGMEVEYHKEVLIEQELSLDMFNFDLRFLITEIKDSFCDYHPQSIRITRNTDKRDVGFHYGKYFKPVNPIKQNDKTFYMGSKVSIWSLANVE